MSIKIDKRRSKLASVIIYGTRLKWVCRSYRNYKIQIH
jgi:hypothetical protein